MNWKRKERQTTLVQTSARMIGNAQTETTKVGIIYAAAVKWHKMRWEHRMGKTEWGEMLNECWADTFIHRGLGERKRLMCE